MGRLIVSPSPILGDSEVPDSPLIGDPEFFSFDGPSNFKPPLFLGEGLKALEGPFLLYRDVEELIISVCPDDFIRSPEFHQFWDAEGRVISIRIVEVIGIRRNWFFWNKEVPLKAFRGNLAEPTSENVGRFRQEIYKYLMYYHGIPQTLLDKATLAELVETMVGIRGYDMEIKK